MHRTACLVAALLLATGAAPRRRRSRYKLDPNHTSRAGELEPLRLLQPDRPTSARSTAQLGYDAGRSGRVRRRRDAAAGGPRQLRAEARRAPAQRRISSTPRKFPIATFKSTKVEARRRRQAEGHRRPHHPRRHQAGGARRDAQQGRRASDGRPRRGRLRREHHDQAQRFRHRHVRAERQRRGRASRITTEAMVPKPEAPLRPQRRRSKRSSA